MGNELVVSNQMDVMELGRVLAESGFFSDAKDAGKAVVKVLAGQELGIGPIASMVGINIIKGKVSPGASIIAAVIKRSGKYNYLVRKLTGDECTIEYFERGESIGSSSFTAEDARKAGTGNMAKFPRNMLFARAMSNGAKWYCPDLFGGPIYEPGELGASVDYETGAIIDAPKWKEIPEEPTPTLEPIIDQHITGEEIMESLEPAPAPAQSSARPLDAETLKRFLAQKVDKADASHQEKQATEAQRGLVAGKLEECFAPQVDAVAKRKAVLFWLAGSDSTKDISMATASALLDWLLDKNASPGTYDLHPHAPEEARRVLAETDAKE